MDIAAYLSRVDYRGPTDVSLTTLQALHLSHLLSIPFENLDIHARRPIRLEPELLFDKIVNQKRGGFCYELNGMFAWLLRSLGFEVTMLSARVTDGNGGFGPEFAHMLLRVDLEEPWLVDVGFGDSFREPLRLLQAVEQVQTMGAYRLLVDNDTWLYETRSESEKWQSEYIFTLQPRMLREFDDMCHYQQTSPHSSFTKRRVCTLATPDGRITLRDDRLIMTRYGHREETPIKTHDEFADTLWRMFGIQVPVEGGTETTKSHG